jgi:predicted RecB family nuclease
MQKINGNLLFSASDLVNFLDCKKLTHLDLTNLDQHLFKADDSAHSRLIQKKGIQHEKSFLAKLKSNYPGSVINIMEFSDNRELQIEATSKAMKDGYSIIYQASFRSGSFIGFADFLRRVEIPSKLGNYSYEVIDTKLSKNAKAKYLIQLCLYSELLAEIQGLFPRYTYVVLGTGLEERFRLEDYKHYFYSLKNLFLEFIEINNPTYPAPCEKCPQCHWREICKDMWNQDDHLSRVANISKLQIKRLESAGIKTLKELGTLPASISIPKISEIVMNRLRDQASLQLESRNTGKLLYKILPAATELGERQFGFSRLPKPNPGDMFFDMEGNPMEDGGLEYLFGLYIIEDQKPQFIAFWAHSRAEEKIAFEQFIAFVISRLKKYPNAYIYHYAPYETTALKKLMGLHGTCEEAVDELLRNRKFIDLYRVVTESIRISEPSYSIKNLEHFYSDAREGEVQNAGESIVFYEKWKETQDPLILQAISNYNEDDVKSTFNLRNWLIEIKEKAGITKFFDISLLKSELNVELTNRVERRIDAHRERIELKTNLKIKLPLDSKDWNSLHRARNLVAELLDFFQRTSKPQWWSLFERQAMTLEEQIDDPECIAGLEPDVNNPPRAEKNSIRYSFTYPEQEFKVKPGNNSVIAQTLGSVSDLTIDDVKQKITFKIGNKRSLPNEPIAISTGGPVTTDKLEEAVKRYARSLLNSGHAFKSTYQAIDAFLLKKLPKITDLKHGEELISGGVHLDEVIKIALLMDHTYLFLQGPPGAGKTYCGSEIILKLISEKKRIGITSNSHKAINNLLKEVDRKSIERGLAFNGLKYSASADVDQIINGKNIKDTFQAENCLNSKVGLVAGTAWLFARAEFDQTLDYVFIDEAGQISIAQLIAIGCSAKNIVLMGDQMQLSQPIQGTHPDNSGVSSLDYLLEGKATIPPQQGIFLDTTWRMHSKVCKFISELVYDSRLKADPSTDARELKLNGNAHPVLKSNGIIYIPVIHQNNSQRSLEEGLIIKDIYLNLLTQYFTNISGETLKLIPENILVVAPYNLQVNLLSKLLGKDARVGTVDKFQGQESEVVIFSMATSSEEDLPRNMEFLFSKNRLNVAISRAKCLSIMVANPALMQITCKTPEQMSLVNTLCWLKEYASQN